MEVNAVDENNYPLFDGLIGLKRERTTQTAMQSLITHLEMLNHRVSTVPVDSIIDVIKTSYINLEKEQIIDAYKKGQANQFYFLNAPHEEYYNQTYNNDSTGTNSDI